MLRKVLVLLTFFLIGIGKNLPYDGLYFFGLSFGDFLLLALLFEVIISKRPELYEVYRSKLNVPLVLIGIWHVLSSLLNASRYGLEFVDLFEGLRVFYYILILWFSAYYSLFYRGWVIVFFNFGVIVSGIVAYNNPMNPDLIGTIQIFNPNVIGNILVFSSLFCIYGLKIDKRKTIRRILVIQFFTCFVIGLFTFSKATWLMLVVCQIVFFSHFWKYLTNLSLYKRLTAFLVLVVGIYWLTQTEEFQAAWKLGTVLLESKIAVSGFGESAGGGSSVGARVGLSYSGFLMAAEHPVFGVGVGNFERVNDSMSDILGLYYYKDDNANSLIFHLMATIGFVGFAFFAVILLNFFKVLFSLRKKGIVSFAQVMLTILIVGVSINFQRELFTTYFFWFFYGFVFMLNSESKYDQSSVAGSVNL
ncbi:O-antigen ligase family protein [Roseivirga thermotolerans]|uniref:O-antigen ligase-related domain-containing protein n=1 Tax=Roseivirga thermotolerans TaxID=1758176 RepID=A0ABQ3I349_9BACT|nr:O-antigen ligase family protein [Roseivirga thermotolerans]GHE53446.1 hypothetical protein GCM10011340_04950 [Roseivirga thermotolerans]